LKLSQFAALLLRATTLLDFSAGLFGVYLLASSTSVFLASICLSFALYLNFQNLMLLVPIILLRYY